MNSQIASTVPHAVTASLALPRRQRGVVLFIALILLLVLTVLGVSLARMQTAEERMAQNEDNHQLAFQAAEATLRAAEVDLQTGILAESAFPGDTNGQYSLAGEATMTAIPAQSEATAINWSAPGAFTLPYDGPPLTGAAGAPMPALSSVPQFMVEELPDICCPGSSCGSTSRVRIYRITSHATGPDGSASATLQSTYRRC